MPNFLLDFQIYFSKISAYFWGRLIAKTLRYYRITHIKLVFLNFIVHIYVQIYFVIFTTIEEEK